MNHIDFSFLHEYEKKFRESKTKEKYFIIMFVHEEINFKIHFTK